MALLAENLVEEWLNRNGYFTIRGIRHGVNEMDLLAVRPESGGVVGWHVEVQVSFRPVGYIGKPTKEMRAEHGGTNSAKTRAPEEIDACARGWVESKFRAADKVAIRERLWPGIKWSFHLVHAIVRESKELEVFQSEGVTCHSFSEILSQLSQRDGQVFSGSTGGDLAEIIGYYNKAM